MINISDLTGLAGIAVAASATITLLPGVARLPRATLALLLCAVAVLVLIPFGGLPFAAYVRGGTGDLSMASLVLLTAAVLRPMFTWSRVEPGSKTVLLALVATVAVVFYPMALGGGLFDPYSLGYGSSWLLGGLFLLVLVAVLLRLPLVVFTLALAVFAWSIGWYESANLWDYLLDPLLAIYALGALLRQAIQAGLQSLRGEGPGFKG